MTQFIYREQDEPDYGTLVEYRFQEYCGEPYIEVKTINGEWQSLLSLSRNGSLVLYAFDEGNIPLPLEDGFVKTKLYQVGEEDKDDEIPF